MKNANRILLILMIVFSSFTCLSAEPNGMYFSQLSSREGLSHSTVISIAQDKNNIMWLATFDGLNRYDGYAFKVYRNERDDENSLMHDVLRILFIDSDGVLWIGSKGGLSQYVSEKDHFNNYQCVVNDDQTAQVNAIVEFDDSHLLLGTESGLWMFNKKERKFIDFQQLTSFKSAVQSLAKQNNNILIGAVDGLFVYNSARKYLTPVNKIFDGKIIQAILPQSDSRIWVGTEGAGLFLLNLLSGEVTNYRHNPSNPQSLSSNYIRSLAFDSQFHLWVGTFNALSIKINGDDRFNNYFHNPTREGSISQNSIRSIYMDTQGGMWLGTYYGGINYYHPLKNKFGHLQQNPYTRSLNDKVISCMLEDEDGKIWIGANDMGINIYDPQSGWFDYITRANTPTLTSNNIKTFLLSKDKKHIYIGTHGGGLLLLNKQTRQATRIQGGAGKKINDVYSLTYDDNGKIWIGTLSGLLRYDESTDNIREYDISEMGSSHVLFLKIDSKKRIWIGGEKSLGLLRSPDDKLKVFKSNEYNGTIINSAVNCIFEDSKNHIWIGTRGGLSLYNEDGTFKLYNKEHGLPGNMVYGILEDAYSRLWISTNEGLSCFSPESGVFKNYSEVDGLLFRQYNMYSFCQSDSGLMYFGGINGITMFYPELLIDNPHNPAPGISKIIVQNREVHPFDETGILSNNILDTKRIKLHPTQSSLTIEFFVANYLAGKHNTFAYMLEGLDKTWNYTTDNRQVTYNNLQHGSYVFKVKAANNDGKWNEEETELEIIVLPHWWQTWWAVLLFFIMAVGIMWFVWRFISQRRAMYEQLRAERLEKEKMEEVNQMKTRFFINISHEFRTPLTLILSPLQDIIERTTDKWQRSQLAHIQKNANKMLHLVNQLMDYRRAELGVFELKVHKLKPKKQVIEICTLYDRLAKRKKINFTVDDMTSDKEILIDCNYLELILSNLLSNAFKFTQDNGKIIVRMEEDLNYFILEVEDTGTGIPEDKLLLIFDRFYQINSDYVGTGIGLSLVKRLIDLHHGRIEVKSTPGEGSRFTVYFPQNEEVYDRSEIDLGHDEDNPMKVHQKNLDFILDEPVADASEGADVNISDTLLIVEDNADVTDYLVDRLSKHYHIHTASNGLEALEVLKDKGVDLILTDVMMPEMDGIKLCKSLKQNIKTCHIPVIILSAKSNTEDQLLGLEVGADDYLPKPFTYSVLRAKIQNMLKSRRRTLEYYSKSLEVEPEKITFNTMDEELLKKAMKIVIDNLDNSEFSTDIFCSEMGMSRSNLHLKLKAITGESTIDFIKKIRFNEACK
ncbi:MAG: two-component regulator propeller domain-containing protein, partial [Paludibacter sp.]|nr:two-component regulator propeller domain-containing protein [Paludibacter sp.]